MLLTLLVICSAIQIGFWLLLFSRLIFYQSRHALYHPPVSIVVSIKNEKDSLPSLISFLKSQSYPEYEIIIVDDYSDDGSTDYLRKQEGIITLIPAEDKPGKKTALELGIQVAKHNYILVTDGDCVGKTSSWISSMIPAKKEHELVLAYAPLEYENLVGMFAAYETWMTAIQYLSYARAGIPYMGVGRNMLFLKSVFIKNKGYDGHKDIAGGDDDLLVRDIANGSNTSITLSPSSKIYSAAPTSLKAFFNQKKRHLSTAVRYRFHHQLMLAVWSNSLMFFYLLLVYCGVVLGQWKIVGTIWVTKMVIQWIMSIIIGFKMDDKRFIVLIPILDGILAMYYWIMAPQLLIKNKSDWNA